MRRDVAKKTVLSFGDKLIEGVEHELNCHDRFKICNSLKKTVRFSKIKGKNVLNGETKRNVDSFHIRSLVEGDTWINELA